MRQFTPDWDRPLAPLHVTPPAKLLLISVLTGGLYNLIWFYRHWRQIEIVSGNRKYPLTQALVSTYSVFTLARRINLNAANTGARRLLVGLLLPFLYMISAPLALAPGVAGLLGVLGVFPLLVLQSEVDRGNLIRGQALEPSWRLSWGEALLLLVVTPLVALGILEGGPS